MSLRVTFTVSKFEFVHKFIYVEGSEMSQSSIPKNSYHVKMNNWLHNKFFLLLYCSLIRTIANVEAWGL